MTQAVWKAENLCSFLGVGPTELSKIYFWVDVTVNKLSA